jgi:hypothetical protein
MMNAPTKCPICGCPTLSMQVIAWGVYRDGVFEGIDAVLGIERLADGMIVCDNEDCGREWVDDDEPERG